MKPSESPQPFHGARFTADGRATRLMVYQTVAMLSPNILLAVTEPFTAWSAAAGIIIPLGILLLANAAARSTGIATLCLLPIIVLCAFQIVLLYLYGNSVIATDMFINLRTTNPDEADELLSNLVPAVLVVCLIYSPLLGLALAHVRNRIRFSRRLRRQVSRTGAAVLAAGILCLVPAKRLGDRNVLAEEIFPFNVICNFGYALAFDRHVRNYPSTSEQFSYNVRRTDSCDRRQIYVYVIGEASRAANWQLYGYERPTNRRLACRDDICLFSNVLTQSNTTHKSVPLFLSSVSTDRHRELYYRKGLAALFREAGYKTCFLSNQSPQGAMVDNLAREADEVIYIGAPRHDMQLLTMMERIATTDRSSDLFFILHCYGSHFSYRQRYPREYALFQPDNDVAIEPRNAAMIRNAYDNSILYTDAFLDSLIRFLDATDDACSAMLYCSDHGEDLFDDERGRFLHASPTVTYYQLHVPCLAWFSRDYARRHPDKTQTAHEHRRSAATTHAMFHTMADIASLDCDVIERQASLVSRNYDPSAPRRYLDDHNRAVPLDRKCGITARDRLHFRRRGIGTE